MAGKTFPDIFCSKMTADRLTVYLASTGKGAFRVGLGLNPSGHPVHFFRRLFPSARLTKSDRPNRPLAEAVEAALRNRLTGNALAMDVSVTPFQWAILEAIATIPFGQTRTYGAVASMVERPQGARAVGQVMRRNPLPLIFP
jgi:O6-methylguanine-DNA--protein-cysteine methyltransferase